MKLNPSLSPDEVGFHHGVISSTAGGFIPSDRTDLVEKNRFCLVDKSGFFTGAGGGGRTRTLSPGPDFESGTSANSITPADGTYVV